MATPPEAYEKWGARIGRASSLSRSWSLLLLACRAPIDD